MKLKVLDTPPASLPPLYAGWLESLLPGPIPAETAATCDDCAMLPPPGVSTRQPELYFNPTTKCCTYLPALPNFLVGRVLNDKPEPDDDALTHGRRTLEQRIDAGNAVSPLGVGTPKDYTLLYTNNRDYFGHNGSMRCPHFVERGGRCGVWRHRNAVCATWFCKHVRGSVGLTFWKTLLQLLRAVERQLSVWCVAEIDPGAKARAELFDPMKIETPDYGLGELTRQMPRYAAVWGSWLGRERDFYRRCADLVNALSWKQVMRLCGQEVGAFARQTCDAYRELRSNELPEALTIGKLQVVGIDGPTVRLSGYSGTDPVDLPRELFDVLPEFDGRPRTNVLNAIAQEHGLGLDDELVRGLVDFQLLVPATK